MQRLKLSCSADSLSLRKWKNLADRFVENFKKLVLFLVILFLRISVNKYTIVKWRVKTGTLKTSDILSA